MASVVLVVKFIVVYLLPFYMIQLYLKYAYGVGAGTIAVWWVRNWGGLEHPGLALFFTFLALLFTISVTTGALNKVYLSVFGENHHLAYLGNDSKSSGRYIPVSDLNATPMKSLTPEHYAYSFNPIYRVEEFRTDPRRNSAGVRVHDFGAGQLISHFLALTFLYTFLICMLHIFAHPVSTAVASGGAEVESASMDNLKTFLSQWNLTAGSLGAVFFGSLALAGPVIYLFHYADRGERVYPLPEFVVPGSKVKADPISVDKVLAQESKNRDRYDSLFDDTGYRDVIFEFSEGFPKPVYVATRFYIYDHPGLQSKIEQHIEQDRPMTIEIQEHLRIFPKE